LDLFEPKIAPFDPPSPKTLPWNKHEVDRITCCRDKWPFAYVGAYGTPILGEGEVVGVSDGTIRKSDGSFP